MHLQHMPKQIGSTLEGLQNLHAMSDKSVQTFAASYFMKMPLQIIVDSLNQKVDSATTQRRLIWRYKGAITGTLCLHNVPDHQDSSLSCLQIASRSPPFVLKYMRCDD